MKSVLLGRIFYFHSNIWHEILAFLNHWKNSIFQVLCFSFFFADFLELLLGSILRYLMILNLELVVGILRSIGSSEFWWSMRTGPQNSLKHILFLPVVTTKGSSYLVMLANDQEIAIEQFKWRLSTGIGILVGNI